MSKPDKQRFSDLMDDLGVIYDREVSVTLKRLYWEDLGQFPLDAIEAACQAHRRDRDRGRFFPKPADLLARLGGDAAHIPPEAGWAIALESMNEDKTVIWTDEIEQARAAARPIWEIGDKYGARMAFVKAYEAILLATTTPPRYKISVGNDPAQREEAVARAVLDGLLTHERAQHYLPGPETTAAGQAVIGLLTSKVVQKPVDDQTKARLASLRAALDRQVLTANPRANRQARIAYERAKALKFVENRLTEHAK